MARRTIAQCDQEIALLKTQVHTLEQELVRRTNYAAEVDREMANLREEFDQLPDQITGEVSDHVLVQARMHKSAVEVVSHLQNVLGASNRTDVLLRGIHLLVKEQNSLKTRVVRRVRSLLSLSLHN
jgi:chromosome segregation ATPase